MNAKKLQKYIDANYANEKHKRSKSGNVSLFAADIGVGCQTAHNWLNRDKVPAWVGVMVELKEEVKRLKDMLV